MLVPALLTWSHRRAYALSMRCAIIILALFSAFSHGDTTDPRTPDPDSTAMEWDQPVSGEVGQVCRVAPGTAGHGDPWTVLTSARIPNAIQLSMRNWIVAVPPKELDRAREVVRADPGCAQDIENGTIVLLDDQSRPITWKKKELPEWLRDIEARGGCIIVPASPQGVALAELCSYGRPDCDHSKPNPRPLLQKAMIVDYLGFSGRGWDLYVARADYGRARAILEADLSSNKWYFYDLTPPVTPSAGVPAKAP